MRVEAEIRVSFQDVKLLKLQGRSETTKDIVPRVYNTV